MSRKLQGLGQTSRVVLLFATLLFAYFSVAFLCAVHNHAHQPHVVHFTGLGMLTGVIGIAAAMGRSPCVSKVYAVALFMLMGSAVHGLTAHVPLQRMHCQKEATSEMHVLTMATFDFQFFQLTAVRDSIVDVVDSKQLEKCNTHVVHMYLVSVGVVIAVGLSFVWCSISLAAKAAKKMAKHAEGCEVTEPLIEVITVHRNMKV